MVYLVKEVFRNGCYDSGGEENSISYVFASTVYHFFYHLWDNIFGCFPVVYAY